MRRIVTICENCGRRFLPAGTLAVLLAWSGFVAAAQPPGTSQYDMEQPARALSETLLSISRQTGVALVFDPAMVSGYTARPVAGRLSAAEAVAQVLEGTALTADVMVDGAIVVRHVSAPRAGRPLPARAQPSSALPPGSGGAGVQSVRLAQAAGPEVVRSDGSASGGQGEAAPEPPPADDGTARAGDRVEVTGSRLKRVSTEGPMPVNTYTERDIINSGQPTLERFLSGLNEVAMTAGEGSAGSTLGQGTVQLRGLPQGTTLVLVNGRRLQAVGSSSANFFNLNLIPLAAVERIEVVPVGSSAVYGGDALAGVVNIILKKSMDGHSLALRLGSAKGTGDRSLSLATGGAGGRGSYLILGSASKSSPLHMTERAFFMDADYRRFGGTDARSRSCTPGTVSSASGGNLPGLDSPLAGIPVLAPGQVLTVDSFAPTSGQPNLCNLLTTGRGLALVHATESIGVHGAVDWQLSQRWGAFGELTVSHDRVRADEMGLSLSNVLVPAANPHNPFGVPVRVTTVLSPENGVQAFARQTRFTRALAGLRGDLGSGWDAEFTLSSSHDKSQRQAARSTLSASARDAALSATTVEWALNPFASGRAASDEVLAGIWADSEREGEGRKEQLSAFARGPLMAWAAGPIEAIAGAETSRDEFNTVITGVGALSRSHTRRYSAGYAEVRVPFARASPADGRAWDQLAATVAGRHDRYSDFGSANTFQGGLELRPTRSLLLRSSLATSFKPPTLNQMNVDQTTAPLANSRLLDPARGDEPIESGELVRMTNRALNPERGKAYTVGLVWEPEQLLGTRLGLTAWRVRIDGLIALMSPQTVLINESLFPDLVTRAPSTDAMPGQVLSMRHSEVNFGRVDTAGTDIELAHSWRTAAGRWSLAAGASRISEYRVALTPNSDADDRLGRRFRDHWAPRWKGRVSAGYSQGGWSLGVTSRYLGSYTDAGASTLRLGNLWTHDLAGVLDLKPFAAGLAGVKAASLSLAIANLANREPQYVVAAPYFDVTQADWRGRYASVRLSVDW